MPIEVIPSDFQIQEASLLHFLARVPPEQRINEWEQIKDRVKEGGFAHKVAMLLIHKQKDPLTIVQEYGASLLKSCGLQKEADEITGVEKTALNDPVEAIKSIRI